MSHIDYQPLVHTSTGESRMESLQPSQYRLARKPNGELVLQGAFAWWTQNTIGVEWRDIPTVEMPQ